MVTRSPLQQPLGHETRLSPERTRGTRLSSVGDHASSHHLGLWFTECARGRLGRAAGERTGMDADARVRLPLDRDARQDGHCRGGQPAADELHSPHSPCSFGTGEGGREREAFEGALRAPLRFGHIGARRPIDEARLLDMGRWAGPGAGASRLEFLLGQRELGQRLLVYTGPGP